MHNPTLPSHDLFKPKGSCAESKYSQRVRGVGVCQPNRGSKKQVSFLKSDMNLIATAFLANDNLMANNDLRDVIGSMDAPLDQLEEGSNPASTSEEAPETVKQEVAT